ncbi:MAG TPA: ABC transporter substrate-binding protein [Acidimicrobiales bacterium]|jgi:NitT/TauT family transport system substrate-binding protein
MSIGITRKAAVLALSLGLVAAACGGDDDDSGNAAGADTTAADTQPSGTLRLGYFPNVTHAPAIIGVEDGLFADALGDAELETFTFNSGTEASEAILSDSIDATFIGPNPAINAFAQSDGAVEIVAGTTSGGAALVVSQDINSPQDLAGKTLATPSLGNTQDVALRAWLKDQGFETDETGGGDVKITPQENADTLTAFQAGDIQGAWVPEPWATRLVEEGDGKVLVNESDLWTDTDGQFVTTHLLVRKDYLEEHPANVRALISGLLDAIDEANGDAATAQATTNDGIEKITTKRLGDDIIAGAWENLTFTSDPVAKSLEKSKDDAVAVGLLDDVDLDGIYDLSILNDLLAARGDPEVEGL